MKKIADALFSKQCAYISFILAGFAYIFVKNATFAYGWIAELYPLGDAFIPTLKGIILACVAISFGFIIAKVLHSQKEKQSKLFTLFNAVFLIFFIISIIAFIYSFVLVFRLDTGLSALNFVNGLQSMTQDIAFVGIMAALVLPLMFSKNAKEILRSLICALVIAGIVLSLTAVGKINVSAPAQNFPSINLQSENVMKNATIINETLKDDEKADAANLLDDSGSFWTPQQPGNEFNNSVVEIQLDGTQTFNTAVIEEIGNEVQYFRLQVFLDDKWVTVYQSEKIQSLRICSFDSVTTDKVRLSIDKFRDNDKPAQIKSLSLYNETAKDAENFEVTAYQRLDGDVPTEILKKGEDYVNNYARFYDVYTTVIVFAAVHWDENGNMNFGEAGEENFAREIEALKEIIDHRSNKNHDVKIIVTALADGTWGDEHNGVNVYMAKYWESIADKIVEFVNKYNFDGVDIDWEYPQSAEDWKVYDNFIARLDDGMQKTNPDAIISSALSSGNLGLSKETFERLDQIQFMAYDGNDEDGYQSSLQQAEEGMKAFADNGADISKINIGIAAYGRPINSTPYWATWRDLKEANYWESKYYNVNDADQVYEGTFCSPALAGDKTAYALMSGAGGVMVFRVGCDKTMDDPNSVACGIENALKRYVTNW